MKAYETNYDARQNHLLALMLMQSMESESAAFALYKSDAMQWLFAVGCVEFAAEWQRLILAECGGALQDEVAQRIREAAEALRGDVPEWVGAAPADPDQMEIAL